MEFDPSLIDERLLPTQIRLIAREIGLLETVKLLEARGGLPTYIAENPEQSQLCEVLSRESVASLCDAFGGRTLDLPKPDKVVQQLRDLYITEARANGVSGRRLARDTGLTHRRIKQITSARRQADDSAQMDLFGLDTAPSSSQSD